MELTLNVCVKLDKRKLKRVINQVRSFARKHQTRYGAGGCVLEVVDEGGVVYCLCSIVDDDGDVVASKKLPVVTTTTITKSNK